MELQLLPLLPMHMESGIWKCSSWHTMLGCSWTYRMVKMRRPLLGSLIPFRVPTLHVLPLHLGCSSTSFTILSSPPLPMALCRGFQGDWSQIHGPFFSGGSRGEQHTGFAHRALAEQGREPGALSGYNLGTINSGSEGSCFLFSFYPLQCLC